MLTLHLPKFNKQDYPRANFPDMENLLRNTEYNREAFREYVDRTPFNLENENPLVGLLQQLAIDPTWDLAFVVEYVRFKANTLATVFKINNLTNTGDIIKNGFYREGVVEHWTLIDNKKTYTAETDIFSLRGIVPLYSTVTNRSYKLSLEKKHTQASGHFAIVGIDLVELAVGWWLWMNDKQWEGTGIHNYLCKIPLFNATLIHNQSTVINVLFEFFVNEIPLQALLTADTVKFTTLNEERLLKLYFNFTIDWITGRRLDDLGHLLVSIRSLYRVDSFNYVRAGDRGLFSQTSWAYEPAILKLYAIYLSVANRMGYRAGDINAVFTRAYPVLLNNYQRNVPKEPMRGHMLDLLKLVNMLNAENMK